MKPSEYDGIYFLPGDDDNELEVSYFTYEDEDMGEKVEGNSVGDFYHIAFFKSDVNGRPEYDETFDAILGDPSVYIRNLIGANLFGLILRKTTKSKEWFDDYLNTTQKKIKMTTLIDNLKAVAEAKG
jgi:hypothetical protein